VSAGCHAELYTQHTTFSPSCQTCHYVRNCTYTRQTTRRHSPVKGIYQLRTSHASHTHKITSTDVKETRGVSDYQLFVNVSSHFFCCVRKANGTEFTLHKLKLKDFEGSSASMFRTFKGLYVF